MFFSRKSSPTKINIQHQKRNQLAPNRDITLNNNTLPPTKITPTFRLRGPLPFICLPGFFRISLLTCMACEKVKPLAVLYSGFREVLLLDAVRFGSVSASDPGWDGGGKPVMVGLLSKTDNRSCPILREKPALRKTQWCFHLDSNCMWQCR